MDTAQWPQGIGVVKPVENSKPINGGSDQKKPRPDKDQPANCPRCNSTNTKFCYYNNYSLSQPRYFCKTCRRYWTAGGSLRNVPVGGGSRKNKRSSSSSSSSSSAAAAAAASNILSSKKLLTDHNLSAPPIFSTQNPKIGHEGHDLNLAYNPYVANLPFALSTKNFSPQNPIINTSSSSRDDHHHHHHHHHLPMMEFLKTGNIMSSFMSNIPVSADSNPVFSSGFGVHDYKPSLGFSLDGIDQNGYNGSNIMPLGVEDHHHHHHHQDHHHDHSANQSTILFPFEELKPVSTTDEFDHRQQEENDRGGGGQANGYWNGMLAGGSW